MWGAAKDALGRAIIAAELRACAPWCVSGLELSVRAAVLPGGAGEQTAAVQVHTVRAPAGGVQVQ